MCSDGRHELKPNTSLSSRTIYVNITEWDDEAGQTWLLSPRRQQNLMGSTGAVPGPAAGGDRGVRDGVVSGCECCFIWSLVTKRDTMGGGQMVANWPPSCALRPNKRKSVRAPPNTCCFTSLYDGKTLAPVASLVVQPPRHI